MKRENNSTCPECGEDFYCACVDGSVASEGCWCWKYNTVQGIPDEYEGQCLCPSCLASYSKGLPTRTKVKEIYEKAKMR